MGELDTEDLQNTCLPADSTLSWYFMLPPVARQPDCWRALKIKIQRGLLAGRNLRVNLGSSVSPPPTPRLHGLPASVVCLLQERLAPTACCVELVPSSFPPLDPAPRSAASFLPTNLPWGTQFGRRPQCPPYTPFTPFTQSAPSVLSPARPGEAAVLHRFHPLPPAPLSAPDGPANTACRLGSQLWPPGETLPDFPEGKSGVGF